MSAGRERHRFTSSFANGLKRNWSNNILFIVLVMAVAAIVVAVNGISKTNDQNGKLTHLVECQNSYNTINNTRTRLLTEAAERESAASAQVDAAFADLVRGLSSGEPRSELQKLGAVLEDKLQERQEARNITTQERLKNPVPPPPQALCGEIPK